jgi:hypothetical protein
MSVQISEISFSNQRFRIAKIYNIARPSASSIAPAGKSCFKVLLADLYHKNEFILGFEEQRIEALTETSGYCTLNGKIRRVKDIFFLNSTNCTVETGPSFYEKELLEYTPSETCQFFESDL